MELLYKREQGTSLWFGRPQFTLWAKSELNEEEQALISKYKMHDAVLIKIPQPSLLRTSIFIALLIFLVVFCFFFFRIHYDMNLYVRIPLPLNFLLSLLSAIFVGMLYYHNKRETIYVKDLIHGRHFSCNSVIALARQEAYLHYITTYFRQVLESAKNWDGTERFSITPLPPEEAKRTILSGSFLD